MISHRYRHATGEHKVVITNRRDARLFRDRIGFRRQTAQAHGDPR
ncbi:hypothetical protein HBB16_07790 [Pseudonocardia sp. MCCB 268]|nr:hypothetical protein [Pseudonocardia cytotoxica]